MLHLADAADAPLAETEVRIASEAVGLNFLDLMRCRGGYPLPPAFPLTFGVEVAGRVVETGGRATGVASARTSSPARRCPAVRSASASSSMPGTSSNVRPTSAPSMPPRCRSTTRRRGSPAPGRCRRGDDRARHGWRRRRRDRHDAVGGRPRRSGDRRCRRPGEDGGVCRAGRRRDGRLPRRGSHRRRARRHRGRGVDVVVEQVGGDGVRPVARGAGVRGDDRGDRGGRWGDRVGRPDGPRRPQRLGRRIVVGLGLPDAIAGGGRRRLPGAVRAPPPGRGAASRLTASSALDGAAEALAALGDRRTVGKLVVEIDGRSA